MTEVYLIYKTDVWHTQNSRNLFAITTTKENAIKMCKQKAIMENEKLTKHDCEQLEHINQTQSYAGEGEFLFEKKLIDTLI